MAAAAWSSTCWATCRWKVSRSPSTVLPRLVADRVDGHQVEEVPDRPEADPAAGQLE